MMKIAKLLLYPFAVLYNWITTVRNYLYDIGQKTSFQFNTTVIAVGNLNVGGSGKTPMVEYLIELLKNRFSVSTLSRGYKRDSEGYKLATDTDTARTLGDEPLQLYRKFGKEVHVVVGEDRVFAIPNILHEFPDTNVIVLDDGFQHRAVKPQFSVLVTDYAHPFYRDYLLPFGRLREARRGAKRADVIVVTKCFDLSVAERSKITLDVQCYAGSKPVFFSRIRYAEPVTLGNQEAISKSIVLVSGIAKAATLEEFCNTTYKVIKHFNFPDHHRYSTQDLEIIENFCKSQSEPVSILTTEKDMVKLIAPEFHLFLSRQPWFYIPIRQEFLQDGLKFDELVLNAVNTTRN